MQEHLPRDDNNDQVLRDVIVTQLVEARRSETIYFGVPWRLTTRPRKVRMSTDLGSFLKRAKPALRLTMTKS